jgi:hypothetical protein
MACCIAKTTHPALNLKFMLRVGGDAFVPAVKDDRQSDRHLAMMFMPLESLR